MIELILKTAARSVNSDPHASEDAKAAACEILRLYAISQLDGVSLLAQLATLSTLYSALKL